MKDNKQFRQVQEASSDVVDSLRETNRTLADGVMTIQDRSLRFTQGVFLSWMELLTYQAESVQRLQQQWGQQIQEQRDAFPKLMQASMRIYTNFLRAPFSFSRQLVDATEHMGQREQELVR
jgi:hypothetical protein